MYIKLQDDKGASDNIPRESLYQKFSSSSKDKFFVIYFNLETCYYKNERILEKYSLS